MTVLHSKVNFPEFTPHVTLADAGNEDDLKSMKGIADRISQMHRPIRVKLDKISWEEKPYRCLYIKIIKNKKLLQVRNSVFNRVQSKENGTPYNPHISLVYGTLEEREKQSLSKLVDISGLNDISLNHIAICRTIGTPENWKIVYKNKFGSD